MEWDEMEHYFPDKLKDSRKERKQASRTDRSKYKKTDAEKSEKRKMEESMDLKDLLRGRVLSIYSEGILVDVEGKKLICTLRGSLKLEKTRQKRIVVVGDFVRLKQVDEEEGVILFVEPRHSVLSRVDPTSERKEQYIAANIDQVLITVSVVSPPLKPPLVDRYILATKTGGMEPVILINKVDLVEGNQEEKQKLEDFIQAYGSIGYSLLCLSAETGEGMEELKKLMVGKASVFSGQSGVGKSSLINWVTGLDLSVGEMVERYRKGRHTTTTAKLIPLEFGGWCIDTPGIKSFGVWNVQPADLQANYPEFQPYLEHCRYPNCTHTHEPDCAVIQAVEREEIHFMRYESYATLHYSLSHQEPFWE